jgi:hypothetical protein
MKRNILTIVGAIIAMALLPVKSQAVDFSNEHLNYEIVYHWGVIWKHAGDASLSIKRTSTGYYSQLVGKTRSWADKIYPVRDTLKCSMNDKLQPLRYEKLTHEKDYYAHDIVTFSYNYGSTNATGTRIRRGKPNAEISLSAKCQAYDMVSVFYMLRNLDYSQMSTSKPVSTVIFSGKQKEYLTITYKGKENIKMRDGTKREAYHIKFRFTQEGGKKSSDNIDAWMSTDAKRIPLLLVGKLPIGEVKCYYKS